MQETSRTADEDVEENVEDEDPQGLPGSPEVRPGGNVDKDSDSAARSRELANNTKPMKAF